MFELVDNIPASPVIKVIGVGGGGGNAVNHSLPTVDQKGRLEDKVAFGTGFHVVLQYSSLRTGSFVRPLYEMIFFAHTPF